MSPPFTAAFVADPEIEAWFAPEAEIKAMLAFETALAAAEAEAGLIPAAAAVAIDAACAAFVPDIATLTEGLIRDGVLGPAFVAALRQKVVEPYSRYLHFGATSQDVADSALTLRLKPVLALLDARLAALIAVLHEMSVAQGSIKLMAHTRMQAALPFTAADKLTNWQQPLLRHRARLAALGPRLLAVQLGGPVGTRAEFAGKGDAIAADLARRLGLSDAPCWHTARDNIVEFGQTLGLIAGALGKLGADTALMAQSEIGAVRMEGAGGSSAMAHKANPVTAELLVSLAHYTSGLSGTLCQALVHENERSGTAWAVELLTLPPLIFATGAALMHALNVAKRICFIAQ